MDRKVIMTCRQAVGHDGNHELRVVVQSLVLKNVSFSILRQSEWGSIAAEESPNCRVTPCLLPHWAREPKMKGSLLLIHLASVC